MTSTKKALLSTSEKLTKISKVAYRFSNLRSDTLILIGQFCDDDCVAIFTKYNVKILKGDKVIIQGRQTDNGLWKLSIHGKTTLMTKPSINTVNV